MACLNAGDFQRILEESGANPGADPGANPDKDLMRHLHGCDRCRAAFQRAAATNRRVTEWISPLTSVEDLQPDARTALARLRSRDEMRATPAAAWYASPSRYVSVAIHVGFFALLMFGATNPAVQQSIRQKLDLIDPNLTPYVPKPAQGGGGGGAREPLPVTEGRLPKAAARQFVPPQIVKQEPKLAMEPSLVAPPEVQLQANNWGDPLAKIFNNSNGSGSNGGMGSGSRGGMGPGDGLGYGPGAHGGYDGEIYQPGNGVSRPVLLVKVEPEYSEDARKAKYSGIVLLSAVVDKDGQPRDIRVLRSLGMGLDEKAIEAVQKWRFKPGMKAGQAVNVRAQIEVNFRLL